jgi:UDP-N-acetyl-D-mannosaminuronic acid transferase (WecB/TagA/CpsF family)
LNADLTIADSAFMVLLWNLLERERIPRISGLEYLRLLLKTEGMRQPHNVFWIMASRESADRNAKWLVSQGIPVGEEDQYIAPMYAAEIEDPELVARIRARRPRHIVITLGGGTQEKLGLYLKRNLGYTPAIRCIGAAIAFLSGDQVYIPVWADKCYLGWLFRCFSQPRRFIARYWSVRTVLPMMLRYRERLPQLEM